MKDRLDTPRVRPRTFILLAVLVVAFAVAAPAIASAAKFDPLNVIPYETYRGSSSMTAADIQAFLATQTGPLKSLKTKDHKGVTRSAAQIIHDAAKAWNLNPKVIISTLQKEESLITVSNSSNASRLRKAMGCGIYPGSSNTFAGFGNQVWSGTQKLSTYEITYKWAPGSKKTVTAYKSVTATKTVDGAVVSYSKRVSYKKTIVPKNASTFALYTYTPYYPQSLVWTCYVRFFGDPATPPRMKPLYRFRSRSNGTYYYTSSEARRYTLRRKSSKSWAYGGVAFAVDTSASANVSPLFELYDTKTHRYAYTVSESTRDKLLKVSPKQWRLDGAVAYVSRDASGTAPVFRLTNKKTGGNYYTPSASVRKTLSTGHGARFTYRGISYYLGASKPTTVSVGPARLP